MNGLRAGTGRMADLCAPDSRGALAPVGVDLVEDVRELVKGEAAGRDVRHELVELPRVQGAVGVAAGPSKTRLRPCRVQCTAAQGNAAKPPAGYTLRSSPRTCCPRRRLDIRHRPLGQSHRCCQCPCAVFPEAPAALKLPVSAAQAAPGSGRSSGARDSRGDRQMPRKVASSKQIQVIPF